MSRKGLVVVGVICARNGLAGAPLAIQVTAGAAFTVSFIYSSEIRSYKPLMDALKTRLVAISLNVSSAALNDGASAALQDDGAAADHCETAAGDWAGDWAGD